MKVGKNAEVIIVLFALATLGLLLYNNSKRKNTDMMTSYPSSYAHQEEPNDRYGSANGVITNTYGAKKSKMDDPSMLLPNDTNSQWGKLNPQGDGMLKNINLLQAGSLVGINTVGSTMRNANLQLRSEPPNPQGNVGPWLNSTIEPDQIRQPLEIGSSA
jgi:hypothetical protein